MTILLVTVWSQTTSNTTVPSISSVSPSKTTPRGTTSHSTTNSSVTSNTTERTVSETCVEEETTRPYAVVINEDNTETATDIYNNIPNNPCQGNSLSVSSAPVVSRRLNILFVTTDDIVYGLGSNSEGQLGLGHNRPVDTPEEVPELSEQNIYQFINGEDFVLAINSEHRLYSWGRNDRGQLALDAPTYGTTKPKIISIDIPVISVSCGANHTLVLTGSGHVYGWGSNDRGQVGCGKSDVKAVLKAIEVKFPNGYTIVKISCSDRKSFAITSDGYVFRWGWNAYRNCLYKPELMDCVYNIQSVGANNDKIYLLSNDGQI
ncbi:unnamed protein product [Oppiella nova]|uniref:Uncharacterized protein n=1 Tax=Oppiella nova TaxID=334625 RepID=A0A7R9QDK8_9ACAR|nr:unnamed protein product [Oppiella nova]CAG2163192.1 unnamed protein product [Oppiella nova]